MAPKRSETPEEPEVPEDPEAQPMQEEPRQSKRIEKRLASSRPQSMSEEEAAHAWEQVLDMQVSPEQMQALPREPTMSPPVCLKLRRPLSGHGPRKGVAIAGSLQIERSSVMCSAGPQRDVEGQHPVAEPGRRCGVGARPAGLHPPVAAQPRPPARHRPAGGPGGHAHLGQGRAGGQHSLRLSASPEHLASSLWHGHGQLSFSCL